MNSNEPATNQSRLLLMLVLMSGFCGISYEILYSRILGDLVGNRMVVNAAILMTFLVGIGLGTKFAYRLWRFLWAIEAGIGLCGVLFAFGGETVERVVTASDALTGGETGGSLAVSCCLLAVPAFLIGCSLPLFAGYVSRVDQSAAFARTYGLYNVGAALTALLMEFVLVRAFGLRSTLLIIASLNGVVALLLLRHFRQISQTLQQPDAAGDSSANPGWNVRLALATASISSAVYQLLMIKLSECLVGPFHETFAIVLAIVLLGLAIGAKLSTRYRLGFGFVMSVNALGLTATLAGFETLAQTYAGLYHSAAESYVASVLLKFGTLAALMVVPASTFGATIPALLNGLPQAERNIAKTSGELLFVASLANAAGFLLMTVWLHQQLDYGVILCVCVLLAGASVMWKYRLSPVAASLQLALVVIAVLTHRTCWDEELLYVGYTAFHDADKLAEAREELGTNQRFKGHQDVFAINEINGRPYFFINGYTSIPLTNPSERIVGAFSSVFAPDNDRALVLGVGSGATAGTVGQVFEHTDAVEINAAVLDNLFRMQDYNFDLEGNPRVSVIHDDAIHFTKQARDDYSLVINTVTTPLYFSSSKLYTADFLRSVSERLTPGGVYVTWVDSRVGDEGVDIILRTLQDSFEYCSLGCIKSSYFLLLCSDEPITPRQPTLIADNPRLARYFLTEAELNPWWLHHAVLAGDAYQLIGEKSGPLNTLDRPVLEFSMTRLRKRGIDSFKNRLLASLTPELPAGSAVEVSRNPFERLSHLHSLLGESAITSRLGRLIEQQQSSEGIRRGRTDAERGWYLAESRILDDADSYHRYGYRLLQLGRDEEAVVAFREALKRNPNRNNSHFNLGSCLERLGHLTEAREEYRRELKNDPDDKDVAYRIGRVSLQLGDYETAIASLQRALQIKDDDESRQLYQTALDHHLARSSRL